VTSRLSLDERKDTCLRRRRRAKGQTSLASMHLCFIVAILTNCETH
jgi:hypothetical protein